ncbi:hypothetical protein [Streptomyces sp. LMG1-1-1.1]
MVAGTPERSASWEILIVRWYEDTSPGIRHTAHRPAHNWKSRP